jgi:hypothetical protein
MRLTVVPIDGTVVKNGVSYSDLDLSGANIPSNIHALQWQGQSGWIELTDMANIPLTELPEWAEAASAIWDNAEAIANAPPPDPTPEELTAIRILELKDLLRETDYVVLSDYDRDKPDVISQRAAWREEIRTLEAE